MHRQTLTYGCCQRNEIYLLLERSSW